MASGIGEVGHTQLTQTRRHPGPRAQVSARVSASEKVKWVLAGVVFVNTQLTSDYVAEEVIRISC